MKVNTARLLTTLALFAGLGMTAAHAATPANTKQSAPAKTAVAAPAVTVKIGDAMLEEYHGGNPADRTTTIRDGAEAQAIKANGPAKRRA
jgi:hypothetical protein